MGHLLATTELRGLTERELNSSEHAPPYITRYEYWNNNVKYVDGPGATISGGIRYIREDLVHMYPKPWEDL